MRLRDMGAEAVLLAGGGRAILLQLANPAVGHAVAEHSNFAHDPTKRLRHTLTYVYALFWGTPDQAAFVTAMVNRAHAPVRSTPDTPTAGPGPANSRPAGPHPASPRPVSYDATDPALQLWVAATLYDSAITMHERIFGALPDADADAIYAEYGQIGVALQMPAELWPANRAAFRSYWNERIALLEVDDTVRAVASTLLHPPTGPLWLRAAMPLAALVTAGLLSPQLRADFGLPWSAGRQRRFTLVMGATTHIYPHLPRWLREAPKNHLLRGIPAVKPTGEP